MVPAILFSVQSSIHQLFRSLKLSEKWFVDAGQVLLAVYPKHQLHVQCPAPYEAVLPLAPHTASATTVTSLTALCPLHGLCVTGVVLRLHRFLVMLQELGFGQHAGDDGLAGILPADQVFEDLIIGTALRMSFLSSPSNASNPRMSS